MTGTVSVLGDCAHKNQRIDFDTETFLVCFNSRQDPIITGDKTGALSAAEPQAESVLFMQAGITSENPNSGPDGIGVRQDLAYTMEVRREVQMVCHSVALRGRSDGAQVEMREDGVASALRASQGGGDKPMLVYGLSVRRLMPVECARLQGFPDTYLDIPYRNKPAADGPKYKALGNSMAVPVMRWIGERLSQSLGAV
ncbi:hypothetical protein BAE30_13340 [Acidithiobacillus caldus]|uniref:Uncharacterized protein n=1 Tax=Acidithiobacillus caldus TaxID=33059 RepID=A0A1E7YT55_9PROT|nr:hypothetical protein BAE30_13340 [Acidithiobacillus caldus]